MIGNIEEREGQQKEGKKNRKAAESAKETQDTFKMDVNDPRFSAVYESHEYAVDPSNPQYKWVILNMSHIHILWLYDWMAFVYHIAS